jgi:hypothetical protein
VSGFAEFPDRDVRGYHVSRLIVPQLDVKALLRDSRHSDPARRQAFYNKDLGEEYAAADARLTPDLIRAAQREYAYPSGPATDRWVTMGVDVASTRGLHVRVSEHLSSGEKLACLIAEVPGFESLYDLMDRYAVDMCVIDAQPERRLASAFAAQCDGRVYLATYSQTGTAEPLRVDIADRRVSISRVDAIDETLDLIRRQRNLLPRELPPGYASHLQAVVRATERDRSGRPRAVYRSLGPDDYLHAEVFDVSALNILEYHGLLRKLQKTEYVFLDDLIPEFERSSLGTWEDSEYHPGPPEPDDYSYLGL